MKYLSVFVLLSFVILWSSCRNDFETTPSTGNLEFSRDTVFLDTAFTNIGTSTFNLKVFNRSDDDITIPTVQLGDGQSSNYRLNVNGVAGKEFENVQILSNDSIFIFIETTVDINSQTNETTFLYTDQIQFDPGGNQQNVELVTLVQDANFLFPADLGDGIVETVTLGMNENGDDIVIEGFTLEADELTFTNEKPYVIYGFAAIPSNECLSIEPGARIYFHENSGILVSEGASIKAIGAPSSDPIILENEIIFEGDRLEPQFSETPGQWSTIWLRSGSTNNEFAHVTIKNATAGILMDDNDGDRTLTMRNVQIYNSSTVGLLARNGNVYGENVVINNSGQSAISCAIGVYNFNHCTFANYWTNSFRSLPSVLISNTFAVQDINGNQLVFEGNLSQANFTNCIIYGNEQREIDFVQSNNDALLFNFNFTNSLIRFEDPFNNFENNSLFDFSNTQHYINTIVNQNPGFMDTTGQGNFNIEADASGAENIGLGGIQPLVDLNGTNRNLTTPDAGAYEAISFPER